MTAIELNWFRAGAIGIMAIALLGSLAITDSALTFVSQPTNGGISNYTPCKDSPNVNCPNGGSAGFVLNTNSTLCTPTNLGSCRDPTACNNFTNATACPASYALNFAAKASGSNNNNQALTAATTYCTGVTSLGLTTTVTHQILFSGMYSARSINVTGQAFLITIKYGTNAPTQTFGSGTCMSSFTNSRTMTLYAATTILQGYSVSWSFSVSLAAGTWYSAVDTQPITTNVNCNNYGAQSSAQILEIK